MTSYVLTPAGRDLQGLIDAMNEWGLRWGTRDPNPQDLDPVLVICMLKDRMRSSELPSNRVVIEVMVLGDRGTRAWLVCERGGVSMCFDPPGFDVDLWVRGDAAALYRVWLQQTSMTVALVGGDVEAEGRPDLVRAFPFWFDGTVSHATA